MSGYSEAATCPRCGTEEALERSVDDDDVNGVCTECGYSYKTVYQQLTLEQVNEEREAFDMPPLAELKPAKEGWTDEQS